MNPYSSFKICSMFLLNVSKLYIVFFTLWFFLYFYSKAFLLFFVAQYIKISSKSTVIFHFFLNLIIIMHPLFSHINASAVSSIRIRNNSCRNFGWWRTYASSTAGGHRLHGRGKSPASWTFRYCLLVNY